MLFINIDWSQLSRLTHPPDPDDRRIRVLACYLPLPSHHSFADDALVDCVTSHPQARAPWRNAIVYTRTNEPFSPMFPSDMDRLVYIPSLADVEIQVEPLAAGVGSPSLWRLGCDEDLYQRGELENGMERHRRDLPEQ